MNSRTSFHGDSLFDQTNRLATDSLANHQFPTFGHKIADSHQGIILHSAGIRPAVHQARSMASRQHQLNHHPARFNQQPNIPSSLATWPPRLMRSSEVIPQLFNINQSAYNSRPRPPVIARYQITPSRNELKDKSAGIVIYGRDTSTLKRIPILIIKTKLVPALEVITENPVPFHYPNSQQPLPPIVIDLTPYDAIVLEARLRLQRYIRALRAEFNRKQEQFRTSGRHFSKDVASHLNFDALIINVGGDVTLGGGLGAGLQVVVILRGIDAGIHLYRSSLPNFNFGLMASAGASVGLAYFNEKNSKHQILNKDTFRGKGQGWSGAIGPFGVGNSTSYTDGNWHGADALHMQEEDILYRVETGSAGNMGADLGDFFGLAKNFGLREGLGMQFSLTQSDLWLSFPFAK